MVAQQQRALVLKSSEMLKYIAEAPALRMGWVKLTPASLVCPKHARVIHCMVNGPLSLQRWYLYGGLSLAVLARLKA